MGILVGAFFLIALCYAAAGFGGGSSYTAILLAMGEGPEVIRMVSLTCNLVVAGIGGWMSLRSERVNCWLMGPLLSGSIPGVWAGSQVVMEREEFGVFLAGALLLAGVFLLIKPREKGVVRRRKLFTLVVLGYGLGLLAGVTGIGGGVYLVPVLHLMRVGESKEVAAVGTWFILVNSMVGVGVLGWEFGVDPLREFGWLPLAVAVGGVLGASLLQGYLSGLWVRRVTGVLVLVVAVRILWNSLYLSRFLV